MNGLRATVRAVGPWLATVVVIALLPHLFGTYWIYTFTLVIVYTIAAMGYNVLLGNAGQVSLAPAAFFGIGAYSLTIAYHRGWPLIVGAVVGLIVSAALSTLLGLITLRLAGFYLALSTLSLATLMLQLAGSLQSVTGGYGGITAPAIAWFHVGGGKIVDDFYTVAVPLIVVAVLTRNLLRSYFGRALSAVREADLAAGCSGINPLRYRLIAFIISGIFAALAGCFYAGIVGYIDPTQFGLSLTIMMVAMVIIGGLGSVIGSVVGSMFFVILPQLFQVAQSLQTIVFGVAIMLAMVLLPGGLVSLVGRGWAALGPRLSRRQLLKWPLTGPGDDIVAEESPTSVGSKGGGGS